ncbi:hypothetical protein [Dyella sp.]|jgi:hypothetical protein|uniref:hypothetical protein n=1 Tax=Dyella sp. TaxID=1869338 RepID=UPI002D77D253|nr:hypothetical protein [Dyella sp.]HET6433097.1 hypothetical protein [Dyella sp.]
MIASRNRMLRQLDDVAVRLLQRHHDTAAFERAWRVATRRLLRALPSGERGWLLERSRSTLAIHGVGDGHSSVRAPTTLPPPWHEGDNA